MKLRPHHILDIIRGFGNGNTYKEHPYGHSQHLVASKIIYDMDTEIKLVLGADAICSGCKYLQSDGSCTDVLSQLTPSPLKQEYNDALDKKLFVYLNLKQNSKTTIREYLKIVNKHIPGIEEICTHPEENKEDRLNGLIYGLKKLRIRK